MYIFAAIGIEVLLMFISPMLLEPAEAPFDSPDFIFEPKIDGHRLILVRRGGITQLFTRQGNECTRQYPELHDISLSDVILDGEVACLNSSAGTVDFEAVMQRFQADGVKIDTLAATLPVNFIVFDILRLNGLDLHALPLVIRKEVLSGLDFGNPQMGTIPYIEKEGRRLFAEIQARQMEGIVAKRKESMYVGGLSRAWQKIINWQYADVVIIGYRKTDFGWIAAVETADGRLRRAGIIELGVTPAQRQTFYGMAKTIVTGEDRDDVYVEPRIRARAKFRSWTKSGLMRDPIFVDFLT